MRENQETITEFGNAMFGDRMRSVEYRALMVLEEAIELARASGLSRSQVTFYFDHVLDKIDNQEVKGTYVVLRKEEAADTAIALYAYASAAGFQLLEEVDVKMEKNRSRSKEYYAEKTEQKGLG